ncbi:sensor histidine kinase [Cellulosimicrobium composti]|uniref:sensor histidine kinase n=1 Tax=Cellulosimicrobium composti TaxID=2672572 RepID=UPI000464C72E|nr:histidine kinase [Cellulosimicrobium composti]TWG79994.1 signal transduction histidine kinase [Cellulosimicrobium cellulans J34]SMF20858.1 Signal transduction histidine kinase [Cellulosimicrobium cellulans J1]
MTTSELPPTPPAGAPRPAPPPWLIDALLGFAVLDVVAFAIAADVGGGRTDPWLAYPIAVVLGLLVLGRRRFPVGVLVATALVICAYYTLDLPPIGLALPVSVALYSAAVAGRLWWSVGVAAALVVASTYFRLAEGDDAGYVLGYELATTVALMAAAIALGHGAFARRQRDEQRRHADALREQTLELEAADRLARDREAVARDLHDVVGHHLAVVSLHANVAREALDDAVSTRDDVALATARAELDQVRASTTAALTDLRATVRALRGAGAPAGVADQARIDRLDDLARTARAAGLDVTLDVDLPAGTADGSAAGAAVYRVVQEGLTNVLRHASASSARVRVALDPPGDALAVEVRDDGRAAAGPPGDGFGLRGLRERVAVLGGTVTTDVPDGGGFRLRARVPVPEGSAGAVRRSGDGGAP